MEARMTDTDTRHYGDHTITLLHNWQFQVRGPLFSESKFADTYGSMAEAKVAIDSRVEADRKEKKAAVTLAVPVLTDEGVLVTVRGVHSVQGKLLGMGESCSVYPDVPFLREALVAHLRLRAELETVAKTLRPFSVAVSRQYGRIRPENYEATCAEFERDFREATEKAKEAQGKKNATGK